MARGWESKSVEEQQSAVEPTPEDSWVLPAVVSEKNRQKVGLELARSTVLAQLRIVANPNRKAALEQALKELEDRIAAA